MSVQLRVTGTWAELTADGPVTIPPTPQAGDRMFLYAGWKDFSITASVANWTPALTPFADGSVSAGNGTGSVKVACWYRDWQPGDTDPTIDFSASPDNACAVIMVMQKGTDDVWITPVARTAAMANWTTTSQSVSASATVDIPGSSVVMGLIRLRDDSAVMTRPTNGIDDAGGLVTWNGDYVESPAAHHSTTTGFDGAADLGYRLVTTGAAGSTLRLTGTISAAETGAALWVVQGVSVLVTPATASLITSTFAPPLKLVVTPAVAVLTVTTFAPQLQLVITPPASPLTLTTSAPSIGLGVVPAPAALSTTAFAPTLNLRITPPAATLTLTSFAPQLQETLTPANATLSVTGFAPAINVGYVPATASLTLSTFAPSILQNILVTVPNASLTLTTFAPHVRPFSIIFLDPGGDATHAIGHFNQPIPGFGTDVTYDNTQQVAGVGSYRFDSNASEAPAVRVLNVLGGQRRMSCYFRYDLVPDVSEQTSEFCEDNAIYSGGGFADPANTNNDDGVYATATPARSAGQGSKCIPVSPLNDNIPEGAVIDAVKIIYERKYSTDTSIGISRVKWVVDGGEGPDHDNTDMPLTDTMVEVDVTGDRQWERKDLLAGTFEIIAEARRGDTAIAHTQSWDFLKVEVTYHPANTILALATNGDAHIVQLALLPRGDKAVLQLLDAGGNFYYGITELATGTNYRIGLSYLHNGIDDLGIKLYINEIPELSVEEANTGGTGAAALTRLHYGWLVSPGVDHVCWFSHIAVDAGDDLTDMGNVLLTAKLPASVNDNDFDTTGGTGAVNERPLSIANFKEHAAPTFTAIRQNYTLQSAATGDVDISGETLIGYMGWVWARVGDDLSGFTVSLTVDGVDIDRTTQFRNTASLIRAGIASTSYPSAARGVGLLISEQEFETRMDECGVVVAYQGPSNPDILLERQEVADETLDTIVNDLRADPPDSYEVCCAFPEFDGTVEIIVHSLDQDGGSVSYQGTLNSNGRMQITPGVEVYLDVTVTGVTDLQIWRRLNVD